MLVDINRRRLAGGADDHDSRGTRDNMPINQFFQRLKVQRAVGVHGGHNRDQTALNGARNLGGHVWNR